MLLSLGRLGRDANETILHTERVSWLDENRVEDPAERELFHLLWDVAEAERAVCRKEQIEKLRKE